MLVDPVVRLEQLDQLGPLEQAVLWEPLDLQVARVPQDNLGRSEHLANRVHQDQPVHLVGLDQVETQVHWAVEVLQVFRVILVPLVFLVVWAV